MYCDPQDGGHIAVEFSETVNAGIMENARHGPPSAYVQGFWVKLLIFVTLILAENEFNSEKE